MTAQQAAVIDAARAFIERWNDHRDETGKWLQLLYKLQAALKALDEDKG